MLDDQKLPRATLQQKIQVLDYLEGPPVKTQSEALSFFKSLRQFAISQGTLSAWVSNKKKIRSEYNNNPSLKFYKKKPVLKYPELTAKVEAYLSQLANEGVVITDDVIKEAYERLNDKERYPNMKVSKGMIKGFKNRNQWIYDPGMTNPLNFNHESQAQTANDVFSPSNLDDALDFDIDAILNSNQIGFSTRLIHSGDPFSVTSLATLPNQPISQSDRMPMMQNFASITSPLFNSEILPNPPPPPPPQNQGQKRNLPYYPTYQNPLSDSSSFKRQNFSVGSIGTKLSNPNSEKIETILENITDGKVTLYNSGTSAIMGILSYLNPSTVFINDEGYRGTHEVVKLLNKLTKVKKLSLSKLNKMVIPDNSVIIVESPMNPIGYVHDLSFYGEVSKTNASCKLIVDSTLAPPPLQFPFQNGADFIVYSAVKYLAGVSDLSAGFIVSKEKLDKSLLHKERSALGTSIANFDSFLLLRSLRTYRMRILTQCNNTEKIIKYLFKNFKKYESVLSKIHHASLQTNKDVVMKQLNGYYNPVFALELKSTIYPHLLLDKFNFLSNNPNLEGGETLVELIHGNPNFNGDSLGLESNLDTSEYTKMLRFSVGCEDFQDLIKDIDQGLLSLLN